MSSKQTPITKYILNFILTSLSVIVLLSFVTSAVSVEENVQITTGVNQNMPAWSPDGNKIVFSSNQGIWVMDSDGSNQKQVFDSVIWDGEPCFTNNGAKIYFASEYVSSIYSKFISIHVIDSDGSNRKQLTKNADIRAPVVSPDGTTVAYISKLSGNYDVWTMDLDGLNNVRLTDTPADEWAPAWSPDSENIVYSSEDELWVIDRGGIRAQQLTDDDHSNIEPDFSPDGSKIVFASDRSGNFDIWLMNSDGTGALQLIFDESVQKYPAWAPDGERVAYTSNEGGDYNIWVMSLGNADLPIESPLSDVVDVDVSGDDSVLEEILESNSILVIVGLILGAILLVVIIVRFVIKGL